MIDSELCRLILAHYGIPFRERPHIFGWASLLAILHGGIGRVPLLYGGGVHVAGPRALVDHFDPERPESWKLLPPGQPARARVEADWVRFNGELASHTAVVAYFYLLPHRDVLIEPFTRGIPRWEASATRSGYPFLRKVFELLLRLTPARVSDSLARVRMEFDRIDARIADGRRYLAGDRLTLADLALATAAAPLLLPVGYGSPMPPLSRMPSEMRAINSEMRGHSAAGLIDRIFELRRQEKDPGRPADVVAL
jgi:glutathione S-transferase